MLRCEVVHFQNILVVLFNVVTPVVLAVKNDHKKLMGETTTNVSN